MRSAVVAWICLTTVAWADDPVGLAADVVAHAGAATRHATLTHDLRPICHKDHRGLSLVSTEAASITHARLADAKAKGGVPITIAVDGLECPYCAAALTKAFDARGDVAAAEVDARAGKITLVVETGAALEDRKIRKIVGRRGYSVAAIDRPDAHE